MTFGEWVRSKREERNQPRSEAAKAVGVCTNTLKNWEQDKTQPRRLQDLKALLEWSEDQAGFVCLFLS